MIINSSSSFPYCRSIPKHLNQTSELLINIMVMMQFAAKPRINPSIDMPWQYNLSTRLLEEQVGLTGVAKFQR